MDDGSGLAEALLGLDGFLVLDEMEGTDELVVTVESAVQIVGRSRCGVAGRGPGSDAYRLPGHRHAHCLPCYRRRV